MFGFGDPISYSDFFANTGAPVAVSDGDLQTIGPPPPMRGATDSQGNPLPQGAAGSASSTGDIIQTTTIAAASRNVADLQARIKASAGVLTVNPNSSDYLVAINNRLKFSVTRNAAGQFEIRESSNYMYLIGAAVVVGVLLLAKK